MAATPSAWANQRLGYACQVHLANHINSASKNVQWTSNFHSGDNILTCDENEWNYFEDDCAPQVWVDYYPVEDTLTEFGADAISGIAFTYSDTTG